MVMSPLHAFCTSILTIVVVSGAIYNDEIVQDRLVFATLPLEHALLVAADGVLPLDTSVE